MSKPVSYTSRLLFFDANIDACILAPIVHTYDPHNTDVRYYYRLKQVMIPFLCSTKSVNKKLLLIYFFLLGVFGNFYKGKKMDSNRNRLLP